ncbi:DUF2786 domain-containing protein [Agrobacterium tumefaciens]|nr:DUF2786 domain-containing protein [Agrobacterium tumefaciens]
MNRETLAKRITALRQMTVERGCTESEALSAAAKAAELMREYGLSENDITVDEQAVKSRTKGQSARDPLWDMLCHCTNAVAIILEGRGECRRAFVGIDPGPAIATYLYVVLDRAVDREIVLFKASPFYRRRRTVATRRQAAQDFTSGLVVRLRRRLRDLFAESVSADALKTAIAARAERYPDTTSIATRETKTRFNEAIAAGWLSGDNINFSHGVDGTAQAPKMIGGAE